MQKKNVKKKNNMEIWFYNNIKSAAVNSSWLLETSSRQVVHGPNLKAGREGGSGDKYLGANS